MNIPSRICLGALLCLVGCARAPENQDAVRQGIIDHLSKRSDMLVNSMDIQVVSVSFRKDEADAMVSFRPKGSTDASAGMQMGYTLERKGNQWVVKGKREGGSGGHGEMAAPGAAPPAGGKLPAGHPPVTPPELPKK